MKSTEKRLTKVERVMTARQSGRVTLVYADGSKRRLPSLCDTIPLLMGEPAPVEVIGGSGKDDGMLADLIRGLLGRTT